MLFDRTSALGTSKDVLFAHGRLFKALIGMHISRACTMRGAECSIAGDHQAKSKKQRPLLTGLIFFCFHANNEIIFFKKLAVNVFSQNMNISLRKSDPSNFFGSRLIFFFSYCELTH